MIPFFWLKPNFKLTNCFVWNRQNIKAHARHGGGRLFFPCRGGRFYFCFRLHANKAVVCKWGFNQKKSNPSYRQFGSSCI